MVDNYIKQFFSKLWNSTKMIFPIHVKEAPKVVGYFSYTKAGEVFCDGDACIISGSEELMKSYLHEKDESSNYIIKKTRFGEIISGIKKGGSYAFDKESYDKFFSLAELNGIGGLPSKDVFLEYPEETMNLVRIQFFGA